MKHDAKHFESSVFEETWRKTFRIKCIRRNMTQNISNQVYSKKHDAKLFESSAFEETWRKTFRIKCIRRNMTKNISNQVYSKKHDEKHFESSVFEELHLLLIRESVEQRIAIIILKYLKDCTIPCQQAFYAFPIGKIVKWTYQWKINFNLTNTFLRKTSKTISYLFSIKIMWPRQASSKYLRNGSWLTTRF